MNQGLIGLAFAAGLVAALNPCGFAMLPAYLLLVVRGQQSDLLPEAVLKDMMRRNRNMSVHTVQNCGHAPALIAEDQIEAVTKFLNGDDPGPR